MGIQVHGRSVRRTGRRNVSGDLLTGWSSSGVDPYETSLQRVGNTVQFAGYAKSDSGNTSNLIYTPPAGFTPNQPRLGTAFAYWFVANTFSTRYAVTWRDDLGAFRAEAVDVASGTPNTGWYGHWYMTWFTDDPWPATLPGTAY